MHADRPGDEFDDDVYDVVIDGHAPVCVDVPLEKRASRLDDYGNRFD